MKIKEVGIYVVNDSRNKPTICIEINGCGTCAPSGKSTGKYEKPAYKGSIENDIKNVKQIIELSQYNFTKFDDLKLVEKLLGNKIGANTLFALEASILKAIAKEEGKELYQLLKGKRIPKLLSNTVGGGVHTKGKSPDFQEFLVIGDKKQNIKVHKETMKILKTKKINDESACMTELENNMVLELFNYTDLQFGIDAAASEFYKNRKYYYKNPKKTLSRQDQIDYMINIIEDYGLKYVEDPLDENDFKGFAEILRRTKGKCLIVGDDLTTTNLERTKEAIKNKSINGIIIKPNQIGSLIEVKKVIDLCKKKKIKIIVSHRSGETTDDTITDLAVGWGADMIKTSVVSKERLAKVNRLEVIKRKLRR
jgi:enolase